MVFSLEVGVEFISGCAGDDFCLGYFLELFVGGCSMSDWIEEEDKW